MFESQLNCSTEYLRKSHFPLDGHYSGLTASDVCTSNFASQERPSPHYILVLTFWASHCTFDRTKPVEDPVDREVLSRWLAGAG